LTAIGRRLETLPRDPATDRARMARVQAVQQAYDELRRALPTVRAGASDLADIRWQIEELRVSLWAQQLGTPRPVSEQRIFRALDAVVA
jgi:ATP-dependent helicase HrpA